jgi:murein DD-endopeptidase MepM/ murein hydrolase activator NlpD
VDIADYLEAPIHGAGSGRVDALGQDSTYRMYIRLDHGDGYTTFHWRLSKVHVGAGETVEKGQEMGARGNTGRTWADTRDPERAGFYVGRRAMSSEVCPFWS